MNILKTSLLMATFFMNIVISAQLDTAPTTKLSTDESKKVKTLNLFDIDDVVSSIAAKKNLKLATTMLSKDSLTYNLKGHQDRSLTLKVNKDKDGYSLNINDEANSSPLSLTVPNKGYYASEIKNFLDNNISKQARALPRRLNLENLMNELVAKAHTYNLSKKSGSPNMASLLIGNIAYNLELKQVNETYQCIITSIEDQTKPRDTNPHEIYTTTFDLGNENDTINKLVTFIGSIKEKQPKFIFLKRTSIEVIDLFKNNKKIQTTCDSKGLIYECIVKKDPNIEYSYYLIPLDTTKYRVVLKNGNQNFITEFDSIITDKQLESLIDSLDAAGKIMKVLTVRQYENIQNTIESKIKILANINKCAEIKILNSFKDVGSFGKTGVLAGKEECLFDKSSITYTIYNFGLFFHLHLKIENKFAIFEYNINIQNFNDSKMEQPFKELIDTTSAINKKIEDKENVYVAKDITFTSLSLELKDINSAWTVEKNNSYYKLSNKNGASLLIRNIDDNVVVSFIDPIDSNNQNSAHPTIILKKLNGYDQETEVLDKINTFLRENAARV